jgi:uncharacterized membrane protein
MLKGTVDALLWFLAVGSGMIAGLFFAFSSFIVKALERVPHAQGIVVMQSINATILQSLFMPLFLGTTAAALALAVIAIRRWGEAGSTGIVIAAAIYVFGMFGCTMVFNVPLNNTLAAVNPTGVEGASVWATYLKYWTVWNHVRTIAAMATCALYIRAIAAN